MIDYEWGFFILPWVNQDHLCWDLINVEALKTIVAVGIYLSNIPTRVMLLISTQSTIISALLLNP